MPTGSSFAEEGRSDTNAYWEVFLLRKAGQTPMLTGKQSKSFCLGKESHLDGFLCCLFCRSRELSRCVVFVCLPQWS